jgi:hypothetical protein
MCGPCFKKHGIDTSVTERRVLTGPTPDEVTAIAKRWGDSNSEPRYETEGVWRFTGDGFIYLVFSPGTDVPTYEDSGRPCGDAVFPTAWTVRAVNDAPDSFWTIEQDGTYVDYQGREAKVW